MKGQSVLSMKGTKVSVKISPEITVCLKCLIVVWALSGESLSLLLSGYSMDVPVVKYFFTVLNSLDGWGVENLFMTLGLGVVFYLVRDRQKNAGVSILSIFFAICTVFGISYAKTDSWNCIFLYKLQFVLSVFVMLGYYFAYKNCILFGAYVYEHKKEWFRRDARGKLENFLFEKRPFLASFLCLLIFGVPWIILFSPGTLQWDAHAQLWMDLGAVEKTGHFPVAMTEYMGFCLWLGRKLFYSDTLGVFFYTGTQFLVQMLVISYANYVMWRMRTPIIIKWFSLFFWSIFPYFPIWGYTMVKDTLYYIFVMLLVVCFIDILYQRDGNVLKWQVLLFVVANLGICLSRNDGRYVVLLTILFAVILYRKYWKIYLLSGLSCFMTIFLVEGVYMPMQNIPSGPRGEILSIPLQQTARYLKEHFDEVTSEESEVLQQGFSVELKQVAEAYNPTCSDGVKANFVKHPSSEYLKDYFQVWFQQFLKHPDTYVQAFLNHIYGYFYPDMHNYGDYLGFFYIGNCDKWHDGYLDIEFVIENNWGRKILEHSFLIMEKVPVLSMLLSSGMYTYLLLGQCMYLFVKKKKREIVILIPGLCVLLICLASPVNAYLRYMMPIMVTLPLTVAWCYALTHLEEKNE